MDVITGDGQYLTGVDKGTLGGSAQDLAFFNDRTYVISQDARNSMWGRLVAFDTKDYMRIDDYSERIANLSKPSHIAILDLNNIFVRHSDGITRISLNKEAQQLIAGTEGADKKTILAVNNKVVASAGKKLLTINKNEDKIAQELELNGNISGIAVAGRDEVYAAAAGNPATIYKIKVSDLTIIGQHEVADEAGATLSGGYWGSASIITAKGDMVYFVGGRETIYSHNFATNQTQVVVDTKSEGFYPEGKVTYNGVKVDPRTGYLYIHCLTDWATFDKNATLVIDPTGATPRLVAKHNDKGRFVANFYFPGR